MSEKITFGELVDLISKQSEQSQSSTNSFIGELVSIIESGLRDSGSVSISGFGKFELRWMKERPGVNPQTGEKITIPGQNKVVFKPYKALREDVNRPYANMEAKVLDKAPDDAGHQTEEPEEKPGTTTAGLAGTKPGKEPEDQPEKKPSPPFEPDSPEDGDDFLIEHPNPSKPQKQAKEETTKPTPPPAKKEKKEPAPPPKEKMSEEPFTAIPVSTGKRTGSKGAVPVGSPADKAESVKKVRDSGNMNWSYAAAAIIVALAVFIIYLISQQNDIDTSPQITSPPDQITAPADPQVTDRIEESAEEPSDPSTVEEAETTETTETEIYQVAQGESLWSIAESELGNPYLWPMIYDLNQEILENPNILPVTAELTIPVISNPENLSDTHLEQVAQGYLSIYEWTRTNNPDEAKYFLWAVGVFSPDMLDLAASSADSADLTFARTR